jgi:hypothetical protein
MCVFVGFSRIFLLGILIFKGLTARRLYESFGVIGLGIHREAGVIWYFWTHFRRKAFVFKLNGDRPNILITRIPSSSFWELIWNWESLNVIGYYDWFRCRFELRRDGGAQQYGCHWCNCQISAEVSWEPRTAEGYWTGKGAHAAVLLRSVGSTTIAPSLCNCFMLTGWRIKTPAITLVSSIRTGQLVSLY